MNYKNMNNFCITNNKGGVAKTTSTVDLAYTIADKGYKVLVVDTDPHLGVLTINALIACTDVLIPFSLTTYSLIGVGILEKTMQELRDNLDVTLPILGVFACLDDHTNINKNVLHAIKSMFKDKVF